MLCTALDNMKYMRAHPYKFINITFATMTMFLKFTIVLGTESICQAMVAQQTTVSDTVMNYIALGIIADLDTLYYDSVKDEQKEKFEDREGCLPIENNSGLNLQWGLGVFDKFLFLILNFFIFIYECIYFHSMPYCLYLFLEINRQKGISDS